MAEHFDVHLPNLLREMIEGHPSPGPLVLAVEITRGLLAARDHGHNTDLIEVSSRWLRDGRCCGRKPLAYRRPTPHFFCTRCSADYDPDGNQIENWGWRRSIAGTFVSKSWPTAETYRSAVRDHGAPAPLRSWPSTPDAEGGR